MMRNSFRYSKQFVALIAFFLVPAYAQAALININTADKTTLESLPHVGSITAQKIIDYRETNGPYTAIEDIQKASTYITSNRYADIAPLITVGSVSAGTASSTTASSSAPTARAAGPYIPPPAEVSVKIGPDAQALVEVPVTFHANVSASGPLDSSAVVKWSFGDGSSGEGSTITKTYRYAGTYRVVAIVRDGEATGRDELTVTVTPAVVRIASISHIGISLANDSEKELDLSNWRIVSSKGVFRIPLGTTLLPGASALFPFDITGLPITFDASLTYPDGVLAASYTGLDAQPEIATSSEMQPQAAPSGSHTVQTVEMIANPNAKTHAEEPVIAPREARNDVSSRGASLTGDPVLSSTTTSVAPAAAAAAPAVKHGLFSSPWTYGLAGVITLAAGAFILL